jgi:hypothetical protein
MQVDHVPGVSTQSDQDSSFASVFENDGRIKGYGISCERGCEPGQTDVGDTHCSHGEAEKFGGVLN